MATYTEEEKLTAKQMLDNKSFLELLAKVLLSEEETLTPEVITSKTNEELGELVRANSLAEQKIKLRFNLLKKLGRSDSEDGGKGRTVPR